MSRSSLTIALAGNPNCGKTTIFNHLTGSNQHVGNYSGVTVEKKAGRKLFQDTELTIVDLPGTYSLTAYSIEEVVTRDFIVLEQPHVVIDVLDGSNLERNLYLAVQLLELNRPLVLAVNMVDVAAARGLQFSLEKLSEILSVPVVTTVGNKKRGLEDLLQRAVAAAKEPQSDFLLDYGREIEAAIQALSSLMPENVVALKYPQRWLLLKLLEEDRDVIRQIKDLPGSERLLARAAVLSKDLAAQFDDDVASIVADKRYQYVGELYRRIVLCEAPSAKTLSDRIDSVLTNRLLGIPLFLAMMWLVFNLVFTIGSGPQKAIQAGLSLLAQYAGEMLPESGLKDLLIDGVIGGVGSVLSFVPIILLLFAAIAVLEDSGYMARAAFIMDRIMHKVGLHGKSFIPLLLGFGCSVPAIMGTRTLENPRDRLVTILVTPFMSCSARLPVYTLLCAAFFPENMAGTVLFSIYILGIFLAVFMARLLRTFLLKGDTEPFVMEMPPYRCPSLKSILLHMWERTILYVRKAGTIILAVSILIWFLTNYPAEVSYSADYDVLQAQLVQTYEKQVNSHSYNSDELEELSQELDTQRAELKQAQASEKLAQSYAGQIGKTLEPFVAPLGFTWKQAVSLFAGFSAKEVIVSTMATIYSVGDSGKTGSELAKALAADPAMNPLVAYTMMVFILIYSPCVATIAAIRRETNSTKWALFASIYTTAVAWVMAFLVYHGGLLFGVR
ncbi:MAG: ferrous iron transport protein B [Sporomusaceae bacterium]|nr:ferrous iron transport protein B [Sporomusaceae bacterium]